MPAAMVRLALSRPGGRRARPERDHIVGERREAVFRLLSATAGSGSVAEPVAASRARTTGDAVQLAFACRADEQVGGAEVPISRNGQLLGLDPAAVSNSRARGFEIDAAPPGASEGQAGGSQGSCHGAIARRKTSLPLRSCRSSVHDVLRLLWPVHVQSVIPSAPARPSSAGGRRFFEPRALSCCTVPVEPSRLASCAR